MSFAEGYPHNAEAEEAVLGSVLKNPDCIARVLDLKPDDFYLPKYRRIWRAMLALWDRATPVDYHTLPSVGNGGFTLMELSEIGLATPSAAFVEHYAGIVREKSLLRQFASACSHGFDAAVRPGAKPQDVMIQARAEFERLELATHDLVGPEDSASRIQDDAVARQNGSLGMVNTGFADIDHALLGSGLSNGTLNLLMGVTGLGKTELALQIAFHIARERDRDGITPEGGMPVLFASLEMEVEELGYRLARVDQGLDRNAMARGKLSESQSDTLLAFANKLARSKLYVASPRGKYTTLDLQAHAARVQAQAGRLRLIVVDYVQRLGDIAGRNSNREQDVALMATNLKSLARDMHCPVLAVVQPNRDYAVRPDKHPRLSDLRESGRLEIEADVVLGLYREDFFYDEPKRPNIAEVMLLKNRSGVGARVGARAELQWLEPVPGSGRYEGLEKRA